MARIVQNRQTMPKNEPKWKTEVGEDFVTLVLDKNEAVAIRNATRRYREDCREGTQSTSLTGAGGRVYDVIDHATVGLV